MASRPSVLLLHTGGTLGMLRGPDGSYAPAAGALADSLARLPELAGEPLPEFELVEFDPLLDSSDMRPEDWQRVADVLAEMLPRHAGAVVLHGTDTMAHTASALSFLLEGLDRPVVLTGSQIPLAEVRNDARENLITALLLACEPRLNEVAVYMTGRLLRGNRCTKVSALSFDAFDSPNLPAFAEVGVEVAWREELLRPADERELRALRLRSVPVVALRLFPGITGATLSQVLREPVRGLVLETYGSGNAPSRDPELLSALEEASARGVVIVNVTQCLRGTVRMDAYAAGRNLLDAGVVSGGDMTVEAALTKLTVLLSQESSYADVAAGMASDLAGELTVDA